MSCITDWLTSIGTISATGVALWFGIKGNRETKILIKRITNRLDREAFTFLSEIPPIVEKDSLTNFREKLTQIHINKFSKLISENVFIDSKEMLKYKTYIDWADNYLESFCSNQKETAKSIFYRIKTSAKNLSKLIDNQSSIFEINKILEHESKHYWDKNVYYIYPDPENMIVSSYLIYTTDEENARQILGELDEIYRAENKTYIYRESPIHYILKEKTETYIHIVMNNKHINLELDKPYEYYKKLP